MTHEHPPRPDRTLVMGVVNVTPDSFSDGGQWFAHEVAIAHAHHLHDQGADILDIGGESTRPGATPVPPAEEIDRVLPVVEALAAEDVVLSIDTIHAATARAALDAGAHIVNDVSGGLADPDLPAVVADADARYVVGHWRGTPATMNNLARYDDVVARVCQELGERIDGALRAGVAPDRIVVDPGLGFAKDAEANWEILAHLDRLQQLGYPLLVGASRKRFLAGVVDPRVADQPLARDHATHAVTALAARAGVWGVRVHDVLPSLDAVRVAHAWRTAAERTTGGMA